MKRKERSVRQVFSPADVVLLAGILAVGIIFCLVGSSWIGISILVCWAIYVPFCRHAYRLKGEKGFFRLREIAVARECRDEIIAFLAGDIESFKYEPWQNGGALVEIYSRKRDGKILARYFDYSDFINGTEYGWHTISEDRMDQLLKAVASK